MKTPLLLKQADINEARVNKFRVKQIAILVHRSENTKCSLREFRTLYGHIYMCFVCIVSYRFTLSFDKTWQSVIELCP
jgi:hypothetical protein